VCVCVCVCVHACVRVCVCACMHACVCVVGSGDVSIVLTDICYSHVGLTVIHWNAQMVSLCLFNMLCVWL